MHRLATLALIAACSSESPPPTPPPPPVVEHSTLEHIDALAYLGSPHAVVVASSYDQLEAAFGTDALTIVPPLPPGLSRKRPVGLAWLDDGKVAFAYVENEQTVRANVPEYELAVRGSLAFIGAGIDAIETTPTVHELDKNVAALHGGTLVSWWIEGRGVGGVSGDATSLRVRTVGGPATPFFDHYVPDDRSETHASLNKTKRAAFDAAVVKSDQAHAALDTTRDNIVATAARELGLGKPDFTFAPAGGVKAWATKTAAAWGTLRALNRAASSADWQLHKAGASDREGRDIAEQESQAQAMVAALTADTPSNTTNGKMTKRRPGADLGQNIADVRDTGGSLAVGGSGGAARVGRGADAHTSTVKLVSGGDVGLHSYLEQHLARVQHCYDQAAPLHPTISGTLTSDASGAITVKTKGVDASLTGCVEMALRGTSSVVDATGTFSYEVAP